MIVLLALKHLIHSDDESHRPLGGRQQEWPVVEEVHSQGIAGGATMRAHALVPQSLLLLVLACNPPWLSRTRRPLKALTPSEATALQSLPLRCPLVVAFSIVSSHLQNTPLSISPSRGPNRTIQSIAFSPWAPNRPKHKIWQPRILFPVSFPVAPSHVAKRMPASFLVSLSPIGLLTCRRPQTSPSSPTKLSTTSSTLPAE